MVLAAAALGAAVLGAALIGVGYLAPQAYASYLGSADLKKRYGAQWALVTGGSSGIGLAIAHKLAAQGINVVVAALEDSVLRKAVDELRSQHTDVEIRSVGVDLGRDGYVEQLAKATADIDVALVFNNAGFIVTGFFHTVPLAKIRAHLECNAVSAVQITHHFVSRMIEKKLRGAVVFTSSASAYMPGPFAVTYAGTKAMVSAFAASLAAETKAKGIDVCCIHPSPVASRFYDNTHKIDMMEFFKGFSVPPEKLPDEIFKAVGTSVWRDIGGVAIFFRIVSKIVDFNSMMMILSRIAHTLPDFKRHSA